jgi:hypothetical protein
MLPRAAAKLAATLALHALRASCARTVAELVDRELLGLGEAAVCVERAFLKKERDVVAAGKEILVRCFLLPLGGEDARVGLGVAGGEQRCAAREQRRHLLSRRKAGQHQVPLPREEGRLLRAHVHGAAAAAAVESKRRAQALTQRSVRCAERGADARSRELRVPSSTPGGLAGVMQRSGGGRARCFCPTVKAFICAHR